MTGMAPSKKDQAAFMSMMDNIMSSTMPCTCSTCKSQSKKLRQHVSQHIDRDTGILEGKISISTSASRHLCPDHKHHAMPKRPSSVPRERERSPPQVTQPQGRSEKVNALMKAESVPAVLDVLKLTPTTTGEKDLSQRLQNLVSGCGTFAESKAKILDLVRDESIESADIFGLLAKFRQERSLLTSAIIKSNHEREKSLQAIHRVDDLMCMLKDVAKDGKGPTGDELKNSLGNLIFEVHEIASNPSLLYDELLDLREEHLDLLADHDKFLDIESCHEKLHEKNKKLQDDYTSLNKDYSETKKKLSTISGLKNDLNRLEKALERGMNENVELKKEVERLSAEIGKVNALKHENTQLKKKLAAAEPSKSETKHEQKPAEPVQSTKKKKGKKAETPAQEQQSAKVGINNTKPDISGVEAQLVARVKEIQVQTDARVEAERELEILKTHFRQLEVLLKRTEVAKTKALEQYQMEKATAQNWKELSEGHSDESVRLREQLDESISHATKLQNDVHQLEQNLAEMKERFQAASVRRTGSPSALSQASSMTKVNASNTQILQKLRSETISLVRSLSEARSYPGDPWNVVECAQKILVEIGSDLDSILASCRDDSYHQPTSTSSDTSLPIRNHDETTARVRQGSPSAFASKQPSLPAYRPLLPPGLGDLTFGRGNPKTNHIPSPIGTGRPMRGANTMTPSPTLAASTIASTVPGFGTKTGVGNGVAGLDWSMWSKR